MVVIVKVVEPPPAMEAGAKLQVAMLDAGGVQPRLTVPLKPPLSPTKTVTCWLLPWASEREVGVMVTLKSERERTRTGLVAAA